MKRLKVGKMCEHKQDSLARIFHQQSTAMPNLPMPAASCSFTRFGVLSSTPPVASVAFVKHLHPRASLAFRNNSW